MQTRLTNLVCYSALGSLAGFGLAGTIICLILLAEAGFDAADIVLEDRSPLVYGSMAGFSLGFFAGGIYGYSQRELPAIVAMLDQLLPPPNPPLQEAAPATAAQGPLVRLNIHAAFSHALHALRRAPAQEPPAPGFHP